MRIRVLKQVALTSFREFVRTPEAVFWTYGFPLVMAFALGLAFSNSTPEPLRFVVPVEVEAGDALVAALEQHGAGRVLWERMTEQASSRALALGEFDGLLRGTVALPTLELDPTRPSSELAQFHIERISRAARGLDTAGIPEITAVTTPGARYIDFLIPGLISLNLLGAGMYGVGFNLVHMRVKNLLRRLIVTPMKKGEFLFAFILSRLVMVVPEAAFVVAFGALTFGVPVTGSLWLLGLTVVLGALAFSGLGVLVSSRARSIEGISGLMNLVMVPMWLFGGSFFSADRFPDVILPLVRLVPLTQLNDTMRAVMLHGAGIGDVWGSLAYLAAFSLVCFGLSIRLFRWM